MLTDDLLSNELKTLADSPAPPTRLDIDRARTKGRRIRRRRTTAIAAVCAAVVAAAAVTIPAALRADEPADNRPAKIVQPTTTNPLVARATFDWLPDDTMVISYSDDYQGVYTTGRGAGELGTYAWLTTHPVSDEPVPPGGLARPLVLVPARQVNGRPAYWMTEDERDPLNRGDMRLFWQVPDGRWASLHVYYLKAADPAAAMYRMAADVAVGDVPVALPIRIAGLPKAFDNADANLTRPGLLSNGPWEMMISYRLEGATITILVRPQGTIWRTDDTGVCKTENGLETCVRQEHAESPTLASMGGPQGLLDLITPLGMDESQWTTDPIPR